MIGESRNSNPLGRRTSDNNDINQVGVQRFSKKQGIGWGALSRGLVNPGLGHCHLRILLWVGRKAPFDLLFLSFGVSKRHALSRAKTFPHPKKTIDPTEILLSWCIRAAEN